MEQLVEQFNALVAPHIPNDWELRDALEPIQYYDRQTREAVLGQVSAIWPVSHALCFAYLDQVPEALKCLALDQLSEWVNQALAVYESAGLQQAARTLQDVEGNFLCKLRGETGVQFAEVAPRLQPYIAGLAGYHIELQAADVPWTDTVRLYLPHDIRAFAYQTDNFLAYKLTATVQLFFALSRTYRISPSCTQENDQSADAAGNSQEPGRALAAYFKSFAHPNLAIDLYCLLETARILQIIRREFPGLRDDVRHLLADYGPTPMENQVRNQKAFWTEAQRGAVACFLAADPVEPRRLACSAQPFLSHFFSPPESAEASLALVPALYTVLESLPEAEPPAPLFFQGRLQIAAAAEARAAKDRENRELFIRQLAKALSNESKKELLEHQEKIERKAPTPTEAATALIISPRKESDPANQSASSQNIVLQFGELEIDLPPQLNPLARQIIHEQGGIPLDYMATAVGMPGKGALADEPAEHPDADGNDSVQGELTFDEWDYRRKGYKKNWCKMYLKEVDPVRGSFVETTLNKHRGLLLKLKNQFEMLRNQERFEKRQREGDDLDLDAITESFSDQRAGLPPSERLFIRLKRDERDVATLFLIDMSGSTEGWINKVIREALLLMGEALTKVGDKFAVYGFSGMRRLRADFFHIKHFDEPYDEEAKNRIAAIPPQEYTRMGPAIRRASEVLKNIEARLRLLVVLSDGKPEDYDDYKGTYAIEDTRHALIEAKSAGIHPFCITIDKKAHDYISHMYGEVNYAFINKVDRLPHHMPNIYRRLTT